MELETREGCRLAWVPQLSGKLQCIVECVSVYTIDGSSKMQHDFRSPQPLWKLCFLLNVRCIGLY